MISRRQFCKCAIAGGCVMSLPSFAQNDYRKKEKIIGFGCANSDVVEKLRIHLPNHNIISTSTVKLRTGMDWVCEPAIANEFRDTLLATQEGRHIESKLLGYDQIILVPDFTSRRIANVCYQFARRIKRADTELTVVLLPFGMVAPQRAIQIIQMSDSVIHSCNLDDSWQSRLCRSTSPQRDWMSA